MPRGRDAGGDGARTRAGWLGGGRGALRGVSAGPLSSRRHFGWRVWFVCGGFFSGPGGGAAVPALCPPFCQAKRKTTTTCPSPHSTLRSLPSGDRRHRLTPRCCNASLKKENNNNKIKGVFFGFFLK